MDGLAKKLDGEEWVVEINAVCAVVPATFAFSKRGDTFSLDS